LKKSRIFLKVASFAKENEYVLKDNEYVLKENEYVLKENENVLQHKVHEFFRTRCKNEYVLKVASLAKENAYVLKITKADEYVLRVA